MDPIVYILAAIAIILVVIGIVIIQDRKFMRGRERHEQDFTELPLYFGEILGGECRCSDPHPAKIIRASGYEPICSRCGRFI